MSLSLHTVRRDWETLARRNPFWAILSGKDTYRPDEFLATGERAIAGVFARFADLGLPAAYEAALDFGCGAGRLSQALARRCARVTGVDVAEPMIELARQLNAYPDRVSYVVNVAPDLSLFAEGQFDLVLTRLVLQHMPPVIALGYVRELVRVLRPGGVLCVHSQTRRRGLHASDIFRRLPFGEGIQHGVLRLLGRPVVMMYTIPPAEMVRTIEAAGGEVVHEDEREEAAGWCASTYYGRRPAPAH